MRFVYLAIGMAVMLTTGLASASAQGPPPKRTPPQGSTSSATRPMSPVALVTWVARYSAGGTQAIDLLILWRGTPGWFTRSSGSGTSGGGSIGSFHSTIRYGGLELQLDFQTQTRIATIQGKVVELRDDNVILVDGVDSPDGPQVVGTLRIDPELPRTDNGFPLIELALRRSPEIVDFLRCDTRLPDERAQVIMDRICEQVLGK